jgi:hypothetical protein
VIFLEGFAMNSEKLILKWDSIELKSARNLLKEKYYMFLNLIDNLDTVSATCAYISDNSWNILLRILKIFSSHYDLNFCIYENPCGLLFDATAQHACRSNDSEFLRRSLGALIGEE